MNKKIMMIVILSLISFSCSFLQNISDSIEHTMKKGDPYSENSKPKEVVLVDKRGNREDKTDKRLDDKKYEEFNKEAKKLEDKLNENAEKIQKGEIKLENKKDSKVSNEVKNDKLENYQEELKEKIKKKIDKKFDKTDEKIVNFIAEKVHEDADKIKEITIDGVAKLMAEKNVKMSKREFLARTYQIIKENNMTSYYLAAGRLLNQVKK